MTGLPNPFNSDIFTAVVIVIVWVAAGALMTKFFNWAQAQEQQRRDKEDHASGTFRRQDR